MSPDPSSSPAILLFTLLIGVSLTGPAAVPESATWAAMLVGLGAIGTVARRRRRVLATA